MAQILLTDIESPIYSENLFPYKSTLNNQPPINTISGGAVVEYTNLLQYNRLNCLRAIFTDTGVTVFDLGDTFNFTAQRDGVYLLAVRLYVPIDYEDAEIIGKVATFVNSANTDLDFDTTVNGFVHGQWNTFYQVVNLTAGDDFEMQFKIQSDTIGSRLFLGGFKIELDDRKLFVPSRYTEPYNQLDKEVTLDFPSVSGNDYEDLTTTVTGAEVGDIVLVGTPILADHYSFVGFVSATDKVTIRCINDSGGSIAPASGTFKIKIFK